MHCELVIPGLLAEQLANLEDMPSMPALERALARARTNDGTATTPEDWLAQALELEAGNLPAGALARAAIAQAAPGREEHWIRLDPVHLKLGRESLTLFPGAMLELQDDEASALRASLHAHFGDRFAEGPIAASTDAWSARLHQPADAGHAPAIALCGVDVDTLLRAGDLPASWHAFLNEAQMLLHGHPVNEAREARGALPVNSVWPWGAGGLPDADLPWDSVSATDPTAIGLARGCGLRHTPLPEHAAPWLAACGGEGRHLAWLDRLRAPACLGERERWADRCARLERDWFAPLLDALNGGRIGMISLHVPEAHGCSSFELMRSDLRRFWRRTRPLAYHVRGSHAR